MVEARQPIRAGNSRGSRRADPPGRPGRGQLALIFLESITDDRGGSMSDRWSYPEPLPRAGDPCGLPGVHPSLGGKPLAENRGASKKQPLRDVEV
jgi:hypothetical protein